jgi:hypothetical protein
MDRIIPAEGTLEAPRAEREAAFERVFLPPAPDGPPDLPAALERYVASARVIELARMGAGAANTQRAHLADWGVFATPPRSAPSLKACTPAVASAKRISPGRSRAR